MKFVSESPLPTNNEEGEKWPGRYMDDEAWVTRVLKNNGINLHADDRYYYHSGTHFWDYNYRPVPAPPRLPDTVAICVERKRLSGSGSWTIRTNAEVLEDMSRFWRLEFPPLIAVVTCKKNTARQQALLDTWVPLARAAGYNVEFFDGERLGVPDDYLSLPLKAKAIFKWVQDHRYERMLKIDDDTVLQTSRLKLPDADYAGNYYEANDWGRPDLGVPHYPKGTFPHGYITGGAVWFSKKAIQLLVDTPLNKDHADDRWVGQVMAEAGIPPTVLPDFYWHPFRMPSGTDFAAITALPSTQAMLIWHKLTTTLPTAEYPLSPPRSPLSPPRSKPRCVRHNVSGCKMCSSSSDRVLSTLASPQNPQGSNRVQGNSKSSNVQQGDLLFAVAAVKRQTATVSDSLGNIWFAVPKTPVSRNGWNLYTWWCISKSTGLNTMEVSCSGAAAHVGMIAYPTSQAPLLVNSATAIGGPADSIIIKANGDNANLVISAAVNTAQIYGGTYIPSGFTNRIQETPTGGATLICVDKIAPTSGVQSVTWQGYRHGHWLAIITCFCLQATAKQLDHV